MTWATTERELTLEALRTVLAGIEGVRSVSRQAITPEMVSDAELPAIVIDESATKYSWENRHQGRHIRTAMTLVLDLQVRCQRSTAKPHGDVSTIRELFAWQVLDTLANNPRLLCQLTGEAAEEGHCEDCAGGFEVRYVETAFPYARAVIAIEIIAHDVFDSRATNTWHTMVMQMAPEATENWTEDSTVELTTEPTDGPVITINHEG